jgi:hypothetical protein
MPQTFPGAYTFIRKVADEQGDGVMGTKIAQLAPVERALNWIGLAASPKTDEQSRRDLLKRVEDELTVLQGGIAAIRHGLNYLEENHDTGAYSPTGHPALQAALQPRTEPTRPEAAGYPGIQSAPIDPGTLGAGSSQADRKSEDRMRRNIEMQERYRRIGVDEGMSGSPSRPDTGINQSLNQQNVPTGPESAAETARSAQTWKQMNNPPYEPTNSDDGTGAILARGGESAGREASGMSGQVATVRAAGQEMQGARGVTGPGEGGTYRQVQEAARQTVERQAEDTVPPRQAAIPAEPAAQPPETPEPETMKQQVEEGPPAGRQPRQKKKDQ